MHNNKRKFTWPCIAATRRRGCPSTTSFLRGLMILIRLEHTIFDTHDCSVFCSTTTLPWKSYGGECSHNEGEGVGRGMHGRWVLRDKNGIDENGIEWVDGKKCWEGGTRRGSWDGSRRAYYVSVCLPLRCYQRPTLETTRVLVLHSQSVIVTNVRSIWSHLPHPKILVLTAGREKEGTKRKN